MKKKKLWMKVDKMLIEGKFNLDKKLKDGRISPKTMVIPDDQDILVFDQHREKLPDGKVIEHKQKAVGVVKNAFTEGKVLKFDFELTDPALVKLAENSKHPEKLFKFSPEHIPINRTEEYPQGESGKLDAIAITNLPNDSDSIVTKIYNSLVDMIKGNPGIEENGENMDETEIKEFVQNSIKEIDFKQMITEAISEQLPKLDEISQNMEKVDFDKLNESLEKIEGIDEIVQNMIEDTEAEKEKFVTAIVEGSDLEKEEIEQFSIKTLKKMADKYQVEINGAGEGVEQNNVGDTMEARFEQKFGVKPEDI